MVLEWWKLQNLLSISDDQFDFSAVVFFVTLTPLLLKVSILP